MKSGSVAFQHHVAVTGNEWLPRVDLRVEGTTTLVVEAEHNAVMSVTHVKSLAE